MSRGAASGLDSPRKLSFGPDGALCRQKQDEGGIKPVFRLQVNRRVFVLWRNGRTTWIQTVLQNELSLDCHQGIPDGCSRCQSNEFSLKMETFMQSSVLPAILPIKWDDLLPSSWFSHSWSWSIAWRWCFLDKTPGFFGAYEQKTTTLGWARRTTNLLWSGWLTMATAYGYRCQCFAQSASLAARTDSRTVFPPVPRPIRSWVKQWCGVHLSPVTVGSDCFMSWNWLPLFTETGTSLSHQCYRSTGSLCIYEYHWSSLDHLAYVLNRCGWHFEMVVMRALIYVFQMVKLTTITWWWAN